MYARDLEPGEVRVFFTYEGNTTSADVKNMSAFYDEKEFLFQSGKEFHVTAFSEEIIDGETIFFITLSQL